MLDMTNSPSITLLWQEIKDLWNLFKDVNGIDDLTCPDDHPSDECVNFEEVSETIGNIQTELTSIVDTVQGAIDAVSMTYNALNSSVMLVTNLAVPSKLTSKRPSTLRFRRQRGRQRHRCGPCNLPDQPAPRDSSSGRSWTRRYPP